MSSQYGEHEFILKHFEGRDPATLRFLDVGAFDGKTFSNTWPLAEAGWSGVCVEPSPPAFCWLMKTYADNPRVELVNAAIVPGLPGRPPATMRDFWCNTADAYSADAMSTLDPLHAAKFQEQPFRKIKIATPTWWDLVGIVPREKFDFVNIDVEGLNDEVFLAMPYSLPADMVCVELDPHDEVLAALSAAHSHLPNKKIIGGNLLAWR